MVKKIAFLAVIVVGGFVLLRSNYGSLALKKVKAIYNDNISPETKLELIKEDLAKLDGDMRKNIGAVAELTVKVDNHREEIQTAQANLDKKLDAIVSLKKAVDSGEPVVMKTGRTKSVARLQEELATNWESYKTLDATLKTKRDLLTAEEKTLSAARDRLDAMRDKKGQLEVAVAQLEAELKNVRLAQTRSDLNFDDSRIGDIQRKLAEVKDTVKTERVKVELEGKYAEPTTGADEKRVTKDDLMKEIDAHIKATESGKVVRDNID